MFERHAAVLADQRKVIAFFLLGQLRAFSEANSALVGGVPRVVPRLVTLVFLAGCSHVSIRMADSGEYPGLDAVGTEEDRHPCTSFGDFAPDLEGAVADYLRGHVSHVTRIVGAPREEEAEIDVETDDGMLRATRRFCAHVERKGGHAVITLDLVGYTTS